MQSDLERLQKSHVAVLCVCVRACMCMCVIPYGGANGSSPGLGVVETTLGQGALQLALQTNKRVTHAYTSCNPYTLH